MSADDILDDRDIRLRARERERRLVVALRNLINAWEAPGPMGTMYEVPRAISYAKSVLTGSERFELPQTELENQP